MTDLPVYLRERRPGQPVLPLPRSIRIRSVSSCIGAQLRASACAAHPAPVRTPTRSATTVRRRAARHPRPSTRSSWTGSPCRRGWRFPAPGRIPRPPLSPCHRVPHPRRDARPAAIQLADRQIPAEAIDTAAAILVIASPTAMRPEAGACSSAIGRTLAHRHGFAGDSLGNRSSSPRHRRPVPARDRPSGRGTPYRRRSGRRW